MRRRSRTAGLPRPMRAFLGLVLLAGAGLLVWSGFDTVNRRVVLREACSVRGYGSEVFLDLEQASNAATIATVGRRMGMSERGIAVALATAMQESKLHNLAHGDRDSLGLFQQRPSQGWGNPPQILDPVYASTRFFRALEKVPSYEDLSVTDAAQRVQRSAYGEAYADHEQDAVVLASTLTGRVPGGLNCRLRQQNVPAQEMGATGLTPRAAAVRKELERTAGRQQLGAFAPGEGVSTGHMAGSAHYDGRAIDIFFRPISADKQRRGWTVASWLVANAERLGIATVIYDGQVWTARGSARGWAPYTPPDGPTDDPVLHHRDHVHVDVAR